MRSEIIGITQEQIAHMGAHKWFKYTYKHFYWISMRTDFQDDIRRFHFCQMNQQPNTLPDSVVTTLPVLREAFSSIAMDFAGPFLTDNKKEVILLVCDHFTRFTYLIPVSENITAVETANLLF